MEGAATGEGVMNNMCRQICADDPDASAALVGPDLVAELSAQGPQKP